MKKYSFLLCLLLCACVSYSAELVTMRWPVQYLPLQIEGKQVRMAYMDIQAAKPNGKTVVLLHGKNFNGWYWQPVAAWLSGKGYRVIVPDQLGFGNADYPDIHYSFHLLAANTHKLLDTLHINRAIIIGHSMGGMLAVRFTLMYPDNVAQLVLENPIGLEDYRLMVPYTSVDEQYAKERKATFQSCKDYQKTYFPEWKPEYDSLVIVQAAALLRPDFAAIAKANALTYQMIYEQPVCYELSKIKAPTLLIIGQADRTVVGKALMPKEKQPLYGQYPQLGRNAADHISGAKLVPLDGAGHIPHIQQFRAFCSALDSFLEK